MSILIISEGKLIKLSFLRLFIHFVKCKQNIQIKYSCNFSHIRLKYYTLNEFEGKYVI